MGRTVQGENGAAPSAAPAIFIAEDEAVISLMLQDLFERRGYSCTTASTLEDARDAVQKKRFAVAVLDINLHGQPIFPVVSELARRGVPCVFTTGYDGAQLPAELPRARLFQKPFNDEELLEAVAGFVASGAGGDPAF